MMKTHTQKLIYKKICLNFPDSRDGGGSGDGGDGEGDTTKR